MARTAARAALSCAEETEEQARRTMYRPAAFHCEDRPTLHAFMERYGFVTLVTGGDDGPFVSHLPVLLDRGRGTNGTLVGHFARPNPHWRRDHGRHESVAIFHGPHAYVSPSWYSGQGPAVPTWNYAVVHARGRLAILDDPQHAAALLERLVRVHESPLPSPWANRLPAELNATLLQAVVAFEMPIERLEGKFKLGQNRSAEDQRGAVAGLESRGDADSAALAAFTRTHWGLPR